MTTAQWFVAVPTLCYAGAAVFYFKQGQFKESWMFAGYSVANCAFLIWR